LKGVCPPCSHGTAGKKKTIRNGAEEKNISNKRTRVEKEGKPYGGEKQGGGKRRGLPCKQLYIAKGARTDL